jgi:hypothetical protein
MANMLFDINPVNGRLTPIEDQTAVNSPGDWTLSVTGTSGTPEAVIAFVYTNGLIPLPFSPTARFTVTYAAVSAGAAKFTIY